VVSAGATFAACVSTSRHDGDVPIEATCPFLGLGAAAFFLGQALVRECQRHKVGDPPRWRYERFGVLIRRAGEEDDEA